MMTDYTASAIKVLSQSEAESRMTWLQANNLAAEHHKPIDFVERLLEACRLADADIDWAIGRYLCGDKSLPRNRDVEMISRELQLKLR